MPRFVKDGPIVPDKLVQELEEDHVVIFCGAGISMGAGLPDFKGLVEHCYSECGAVAPPAGHEDWSWLDRMLGTLEARHAGQMRATAAERLSISVKPKDLALHDAILKLARLRGGSEPRSVSVINPGSTISKPKASKQAKTWPNTLGAIKTVSSFAQRF